MCVCVCVSFRNTIYSDILKFCHVHIIVFFFFFFELFFFMLFTYLSQFFFLLIQFVIILHIITNMKKKMSFVFCKVCPKVVSPQFRCVRSFIKIFQLAVGSKNKTTNVNRLRKSKSLLLEISKTDTVKT